MSCLSRLFRRRATPDTPPRSGTDKTLLLWCLLCIITLGSTVALIIGGIFDICSLEQIRLLAGHPFYIDAAAAQVSLLPPAGIFTICTFITLYLALVLLRCRSFAKRTQICFLAALATALPGLLCILWDGILYMAAPLFCVCLLWVLTALIPAIFSRHSQA